MQHSEHWLLILSVYLGCSLPSSLFLVLKFAPLPPSSCGENIIMQEEQLEAWIMPWERAFKWYFLGGWGCLHVYTVLRPTSFNQECAQKSDLSYRELFLSWLKSGCEMTQRPISIYIQIVGRLVPWKKWWCPLQRLCKRCWFQWLSSKTVRSVNIVTTPFGQWWSLTVDCQLWADLT